MLADEIKTQLGDALCCITTTNSDMRDEAIDALVEGIDELAHLRAREMATDDLRDRIAMAALQGLLASESENTHFAALNGRTRHECAAAEAYAMADAMLRARESTR